jgi:hypothetical protein
MAPEAMIIYQRQAADKVYSKGVQLCYSAYLNVDAYGNVHTDGLNSCIKGKDDIRNTALDSWSIGSVYKSLFTYLRWLTLFVIVGIPALIYGSIRLLVAVSWWVRRGFQT